MDRSLIPPGARSLWACLLSGLSCVNLLRLPRVEHGLRQWRLLASPPRGVRRVNGALDEARQDSVRPLELAGGVGGANL